MTDRPLPPVNPTRPQRPKLLGLEAGRGVAALFVLVSHASIIIVEPRFLGLRLWDGRLEKFGAGVDFFFVLSGFIIAWAHMGDIGRPDRLGNYASRRFRRIYPPYWAVLLPLALAYALFPAAGQPNQHDPWNLLFSFFLLPYPDHPVLGVAWTLVYEIFFYVLFGLAILRGRLALLILPLWGAAILAACLLPRLVFPFSILLDSINLEFLIGVATAWYLRRHMAPLPAMLAIGGFGCFLCLILLPAPVIAHPLAFRLGYGLSIATGILGLVELERTRGLAVPALLSRLGAASYAIYLVHGIAISLAIQIIVRLAGHTLPLLAALAGLTVAGIAAGFAFHLMVEKPLSRMLAQRARRREAGRDGART